MKIAHIIKTKSIKSDGRLLKWIESLREKGFDSEVFAVEDNNEENKYRAYQADIFTSTLFFRKIFNKKKGYLFKIPEFSLKSVSFYLKSNAEVFIFHDVQHYMTLFILCLFRKKNSTKKLVWDLHELPHSSLARIGFTRKVVRYILSNVDLIIYTNIERRKWILDHFKHVERNYVILNNYPSKTYIDQPKTNIPSCFPTNFKDKPYLLWMGAASKNRNFWPVLRCFEKWNEDVNLVIMGGVEDDIQSYINEQQELSARIFSKFVNQNEIIHFVDNALLSFVFYKQSSPNNLYCEPNRLYQLITRGVPVIVGNNPPMKNVVEKYSAGIVLPDDGSDEESLMSALEQLYEQLPEGDLSTDLSEKYQVLTWDKQFSNITQSIKEITNYSFPSN